MCVPPPPPPWWGRSGVFSPKATVVTRAGGPEGHWPRVAVMAGRRQHHGCSGVAPGTNVHGHFILTTGVYLSCPTSPETPEDGCSGVGCSAPRDPVGNGSAPPNPPPPPPAVFSLPQPHRLLRDHLPEHLQPPRCLLQGDEQGGGTRQHPKIPLPSPPQQSHSHPWVLQLHRCQSPTSSPCCPLFNLII